MKRALIKWGALVANGVVLLAAVGLGATMVLAERDLRGAEETLVRGEGDSLLALIRSDMRFDQGAPSATRLREEVDRLSPSGLTYLAFGLSPNLGEAGVSAFEGALMDERSGAGGMLYEHGKARIVERLPRHLGPHSTGPRGLPPPLGVGDVAPPSEEGAHPPPFPARGFGPPGGEGGAVLLVIEFEPRRVRALNGTMHRTTLAGGAATLVLFAAAIALTVATVRRAGWERRAELQRRLAALGEMSGVMAHELRNPLASLKGNAQLLSESLEGSKEHERANLVVAEATRLERLTNDLLEFVRDGAMELGECSPSLLIERSMRGMDSALLQVDLSHAPAHILIDDVRLAAALGNLIKNAIQANGGKERAVVRVIAKGGDVLVEVEDQGPGLPRGEEQRIFEPFVTTRVQGTGLGLAVARRAVHQHGGTLTGETLPSGGALFRMTLPGAVKGAPRERMG